MRCFLALLTAPAAHAATYEVYSELTYYDPLTFAVFPGYDPASGDPATVQMDFYAN